MKIIKNSDIKFRINKKLVYLPNFTIRFYTVNQKEYFLEKTQDDLVEYEREATVDDVDVILSGGTTVTEYYLPLNWNQLMFVGKGVLNYKLTNNIEDPEFPDYQYNKEEIVTTDFYIDSIEVDPEPEEGLIERIVLLEEHLAEEIVNREEADAAISGAVDSEIARAISAETALQEALDAEETRATSAETALNEALQAETNRATSAETALDTKIDQEIADRQTDVNAEEARAISAETALDAKIDKEIQDRKDDVDAEETRATTAENAISGALDSYITTNNAALQNEITRATAAEAALDTKANTISGNVITETTRATAKEDAISGKLDTYIASNDAALQSEVTRATTAEEALQTAITNEVSRASEAESGITNSLNAEVTRATGIEAAIDAKIDTVSGNVISETSRATTAENALSGAIDSLDVRFFDDAKYEDSGNTKVINFYNAGVVKATIDASDFIVDGMVEDVRIENGYLVIDFNTASGKQDIQIPLTDIFNPNNYYTKSETSGATEISTALAQKLAISDFNTYSGAVDTLINSKASQSDLDALNGVVTAHTADTTVHVTTSDKTKWNKVDDKLDVTDFNTYSGTVDTKLNTISGAVDTKLDATAYTPTVVDSSLSVASTNPVQNQALYDELRIDNGGETETTLVFESQNSTNYPEGCTKIKIEDIPLDFTTNRIYFIDDGSGIVGQIVIETFESITVDSSGFQAATYEIDGTTVTISYPTVTTVAKLITDGSYGYTYKAVTTEPPTVLKDQVVANTTALFGKVDTSAITTSVTSSSTDAQVPSAKAVYDIVGNIETLLSQI